MASSVLIVDDCATVRHFIRLLLAGEPQIDQVFEASSADEIWGLIDRAPIDVITLDMNLPGANGLQVLERLKAQSTSGIIVVSGDAGVHEQALSLGAAACFEKDRLMPDRAQFISSIVDLGNLHSCRH